MERTMREVVDQACREWRERRLSVNIRARYGMVNDEAGIKRFEEDPDFVPFEVEEEAEAMGMDMDDPQQRAWLR